MKSYSALPEILSAWGWSFFRLLISRDIGNGQGKTFKSFGIVASNIQLEAPKLYQWFNAFLVVKRHDPPPAPA